MGSKGGPVRFRVRARKRYEVRSPTVTHGALGAKRANERRNGWHRKSVEASNWKPSRRQGLHDTANQAQAKVNRRGVDDAARWSVDGVRTRAVNGLFLGRACVRVRTRSRAIMRSLIINSKAVSRRSNRTGFSYMITYFIEHDAGRQCNACSHCC